MPSSLVDLDLTQKRIAAHARRIFWKMRFRTQADMAKAMSVNPGHLSSVLSGQRPPGLDFLLRLADLAHESLDYLCFKDPPEDAASKPAQFARQAEEQTKKFETYEALPQEYKAEALDLIAKLGAGLTEEELVVFSDAYNRAFWARVDAARRDTSGRPSPAERAIAVHRHVMAALVAARDVVAESRSRATQSAEPKRPPKKTKK